MAPNSHISGNVLMLKVSQKLNLVASDSQQQKEVGLIACHVMFLLFDSFWSNTCGYLGGRNYYKLNFNKV